MNEELECRYFWENVPISCYPEPVADIRVDLTNLNDNFGE